MVLFIIDYLSVPNFIIIGSIVTEICRQKVFHISGRPTSWIYDYVIILLHPVI